MNNLETNNKQRLYYLDNLRNFMVFLVIVLHSALVYESLGFASFWWVVDDPDVTNASYFITSIIDIFVMSIIFYISGYFAPKSLEKHNPLAFAVNKSKRLLIPWVIASLTLIPMYKFFFLYSRGLPQEHWTSYFPWSNGVLSLAWLWFLPVLFAFNILYIGISKIRIKLNLGAVIGLIIVIGTIYSITMRFLGWEGWTKLPFINFQNERLVIYFMYFLLGSYSARLGLLTKQTERRNKYSAITTAAALLPVLFYLFLQYYRFINPAFFIISPVIHTSINFLSFHLSILGVLYFFIKTFNIYNSIPSKLLSELNSNTYGVYIVHNVVLGAVATMMLSIKLPGFLKLTILTILTFVISNLFVSGYKTLANRG